MQSESLAPEAWRKKLEETFVNNKYHRSLVIVECLWTNEPFITSVASRESKIHSIRNDALKNIVEVVEPDIELVKTRSCSNPLEEEERS